MPRRHKQLTAACRAIDKEITAILRDLWAGRIGYEEAAFCLEREERRREAVVEEIRTMGVSQ